MYSDRNGKTMQEHCESQNRAFLWGFSAFTGKGFIFSVSLFRPWGKISFMCKVSMSCLCDGPDVTLVTPPSIWSVFACYGVLKVLTGLLLMTETFLLIE